MSIGIYADFRTDKFADLFKNLAKKKINVSFIGQKNHINKLQSSLTSKYFFFYKFNYLISNNKDLSGNRLFLLIINYVIFLKNYLISILFIRKSNIKILIVSDDRSPDILLSLIKICKKKRIKIILLPSGIFSSKKFVVQNRMTNLKNFMCQKKIINKNNLFTKIKGKYLSFYRKDILKLYNFFNILPKNPWISGSNVDEIIFFSEASKNYYISLGIKKKLILDLKSETFKNQKVKKKFFFDKNYFLSSYKIKPNSNVLIFQPMPWFEHNITNKEEHFKRNYELAKLINNSIRRSNIRCLVSLHPKQNIKEYEWLNDQFRFSIIKEKLFDTICFADIYIIGYEGDTMIWSSDLKIPCLITNFYKQKSLKFNDKYLHYCNNKKKFSDLINLYSKRKLNIFRDVNYYKNKQSLIANYLIKKINVN